MKVSYDFSGRTVIVAGAASGIGRATVQGCLEAGATVHALDIDAAGLSSWSHRRFVTCTLDVAA